MQINMIYSYFLLISCSITNLTVQANPLLDSNSYIDQVIAHKRIAIAFSDKHNEYINIEHLDQMHNEKKIRLDYTGSKVSVASKSKSLSSAIVNINTTNDTWSYNNDEQVNKLDAELFFSLLWPIFDSHLNTTETQRSILPLHVAYQMDGITVSEESKRTDGGSEITLSQAITTYVDLGCISYSSKLKRETRFTSPELDWIGTSCTLSNSSSTTISQFTLVPVY